MLSSMLCHSTQSRSNMMRSGRQALHHTTSRELLVLRYPRYNHSTYGISSSMVDGSTGEIIMVGNVKTYVLPIMYEPPRTRLGQWSNSHRKFRKHNKNGMTGDYTPSNKPKEQCLNWLAWKMRTAHPRTRRHAKPRSEIIIS